jgi:hypothetical protein
MPIEVPKKYQLTFWLPCKQHTTTKSYFLYRNMFYQLCGFTNVNVTIAPSKYVLCGAKLVPYTL